MILKTDSLTPEAITIIKENGTEFANIGHYNTTNSPGTYLCRQCGIALFRSTDKFLSGCGWPSFDDEINNRIIKTKDVDGHRTEILCKECQAHLGHIFEDEGYTPKNRRYCVNSLSIDFIQDASVLNTEEIIIAGGCFWGIAHLMKKTDGVLLAECGYTGGKIQKPSYQIVCEGHSGHLEAVRVVFDTLKVTLQEVLKLFFEIHNTSQSDGQGADIGHQYSSAIFYHKNTQKLIAQQLIKTLKEKGFIVTTALIPARIFWRSEDYHQDYYLKHKTKACCHHRINKFD